MSFLLYAIVVLGGSFGFMTVFGTNPATVAGVDGVLLTVGYLAMGLRVVNEWERRPVLFLGKYSKTAGPGLVWADPLLHSYLDPEDVCDRVTQLEVPNVQTKDNVPISFKLVLTTRVAADRVRDFVVKVEDGLKATRSRTISSVTECVGKSDLDAILHGRDVLSEQIKIILTERVKEWGVEITAIELTDIKITDASIEQAIAMKARARKEADAELARAEAQRQIAIELKEAAAQFDDATWRLKNLETLVELCRSAENNTIIIPSDLLQSFKNALTLEAKSS